jgi:1-acyl-sn-glycerol-3-phosphate acyltransferase
MPKFLNSFILIQFFLVLTTFHTQAESIHCQNYLSKTEQVLKTQVQEISTFKKISDKTKKYAIQTLLKAMAYFKGLPKYFNKIEQLRKSGDYLKYDNFGEMGLAEIGISVRYNNANFESLNTGKPLILIGNHHLGIADGLALQYISSKARTEKPSLLFLARWIEKILPHAVFGDEKGWGTAIPVDINTPKLDDPDYETKMSEINKFNSSWSRPSLRVLRSGGALIIFPAGHVASINKNAGEYPESVFDAPDSWQEGFLNLAEFAKADIVFANIVSVNSKDFYEKRKRFGGGDLERVIWFFSEALAKKEQSIDVELSKPMSLDEVYEKLSQAFSYPKEKLMSDRALTAELMRQYTYRISEFFPQILDTTDLPKKNKL